MIFKFQRSQYSIGIITIVKLYFKEHAEILCLSIKHDLS